MVLAQIEVEYVRDEIIEVIGSQTNYGIAIDIPEYIFEFSLNLHCFYKSI